MRKIQLTKITPPLASNPVPRPRLFRRLEQLLNVPVVWLTSPPGAGKTTLASTYLCTHAARHLWYQLDAGDANIATFFLPAYRRPSACFVLSRAEPPPVFARLRLRDQLAVVDGNELNLTLDEAQAVAAAMDPPLTGIRFSPRRIERAHTHVPWDGAER